jgi:hypothetical protein
MRVKSPFSQSDLFGFIGVPLPLSAQLSGLKNFFAPTG